MAAPLVQAFTCKLVSQRHVQLRTRLAPGVLREPGILVLLPDLAQLREPLDIPDQEQHPVLSCTGRPLVVALGE
jgi:hypothetical protein